MPIFKKGNINDVENDRGITLLSTLGRLFTRIINNRLTFWSYTFNIIGDTQSGFRKSRSTVDNVFMLQSVIDSCLNTKRRLHVAFINFKKAFDDVNRDCLWYKLLKSGIRGPIFNIIKDMYCNTASKVKHSGVFSNNLECNLGVRQGESLSHFLFNSLTGIIIFENSWKNMDTMDRIPCWSVSMHIKHFKLGQATDHIC